MRLIPGPASAGLMTSMCVLAAAAVGLTAQASGTRGRPLAKEAKTVSLAETAHLEYTEEEISGSALSERGRAVGTYNAPVRAGLTVHAKYVTAVVTIYPKGGSITGTAYASYKLTGSVGSFHGSLIINRGTGTYRHISGKLEFRGAINHQNLKMWAVTSGPATY